MKKKVNLKPWILMIVLAIVIAACKKSNTEPDTTPTPLETVSLTIADLKAKSTSASVTLAEPGKLLKVKGLVISDKDAKNINAKTAVIAQADNAAGIVVNFTAQHDLALGAEVEISVSNQKLVQQNGEIVLDAIPVDNVKTTATGKLVTAKSTTIADIIANKTAWNGTLVSIGEGMFTGSGKYNGTLTYNIESASIKSAISAGAVFENSEYPALSKGLTGIVRISGDGVFLNVRNTSDVKQAGTFLYVEDFSGATPGIYTTFSTIATDQQLFDKTISTTFTNTYGTKVPEWLGTGWTRNLSIGVNAINTIKTIAPGSNDADASFITAAKNYYCILPHSPAGIFPLLNDPTSTWYGTEWNYFSSSLVLFRGSGSDDLLKNIKSITIVCAGSKKKIKDFDPESVITKDATFNDFDPSKDGFTVNLGTNKLEKLYSSTYKNQGIWQTVKFDNIGGKLANLDNDGNGRRSLYLTFSSAVNQRGTLNTDLNGDRELVVGSPIIIDKIILEFTEKPAWAK